MQTLKSEYGVVIEDCLGICTSTRTEEEKTIDSPSVATPKVELWLLLASSASMTPDNYNLTQNWPLVNANS